MSVPPFFENEAFGPDDIRTMSIVLDEVCNSIHLTNDAETEREDLAKRIIALARHGERNPAALRDGLLRELAVKAWRGLSHSDIIGPDDRAQPSPRLR